MRAELSKSRRSGFFVEALPKERLISLFYLFEEFFHQLLVVVSVASMVGAGHVIVTEFALSLIHI